ncbi:MAG: DUF2793 domain-containing protein [Candidatus Thorarchaeota archaeon]|jgi:hypothetical protein
MADTSLSNQIYLSRNEIKNQIISWVQSYLELENVDLTKSSFLSFVIEVLATLTSNILFYQISTYKEFFLTKAQLPESILNLSAFLGYTPQTATPATANVLITIPFGFPDSNTSFTIPEEHSFKAGDIIFKTYYETVIDVQNNSSVSVTLQEENRSFNLPVDIDSDEFSFLLPVRQFSTDVQEFQIDLDLQTYQFFSLDVELDGQVSSVLVEVREAESAAWTAYTEFNSLFLMDQNDTGYVRRRTDTGVRLSFGNGLIGAQPPAGGTVRVTSNLTEGATGNVVQASIITGDRIYNTTLAGLTQLVSYAVTNTSSASGGEDEESVEEVRSNSIANLVALNRIVSGSDYVNTDVIISDSPLGSNNLPILKRSDLKANEVVLFTTLSFDGSIVPMRNTFETFYSKVIPRETIISINEVDYYTLFDMEIDDINTVANYEYVLHDINLTPTLSTTYNSDYDIIADELVVRRSGTAAIYELSYVSSEADAGSTACTMEIVETGATFSMTNDSTSAYILTFPNYVVIPQGELTYRFTISDSNGLVATYTVELTFRRLLDDFSMSNVVMPDSTSYIIYDIPVIKKEYYDSISKTDFESEIMQTLVSTVTFEDYKMLTDFVNLKFGNTTGSMTNMQLNPSSRTVISIESIPPASPSLGDTYIVENGTGAWQGQNDKFAVLSDETAVTWTFLEPNPDQTVLLQSNNKKYIYSEVGWVIPEYDIPIQIEVDVFKSDTYSGSLGDLTDTVRTTIYNEFSSRFGININLFRSEIIDVVQEVDGVEHCRVIKPESSIFFDYDIDDFTQQELLEFAPDYVFFTLSDISVRVF